MGKTTALKQNEMGTAPVGKLLMKMALPVIASMLVQAFYNIVDSIFVAQINEYALTAVSLAFPIQNLMIAIISGTMVGINALLSKSLGEKNKEMADSIAAHGVFLSILITIAFIILSFFIIDPFISAQSEAANPLIHEYGVTYISICMLVSVGLNMETCFERLLNSTGKTNLTMVSQLVGAGINIALDPILIFGLLGLPKMGVAGAATATVIGQCVAAIVAFILNRKKNTEIKVTLKGFRPDGGLIKKIYMIGVPSIIMVGIGSIMTFLMNIILNSYTSTAVAVFGVYFKISSIMYFPVFGVTTALVTIAAYNYGARQKERLSRSVRIGVLVSMAFMTIGALLFWLIPEQLLLMFNASDDMIGIGVVALRIIGISFIPAGYCITISSVLQALGSAFYSMIVSLCRQLLVLLPAAYILSLFFDLDMVWWCYPIAEVIAVVLNIIFYRKVYNKKIAVL